MSQPGILFRIFTDSDPADDGVVKIDGGRTIRRSPADNVRIISDAPLGCFVGRENGPDAFFIENLDIVLPDNDPTVVVARFFVIHLDMVPLVHFDRAGSGLFKVLLSIFG